MVVSHIRLQGKLDLLATTTNNAPTITANSRPDMLDFSFGVAKAIVLLGWDIKAFGHLAPAGHAREGGHLLFTHESLGWVPTDARAQGHASAWCGYAWVR